MLVRFSLVVVLKVIYQNMPLYLASAFPFSLQRCPTIDSGRPLISDSSCMRKPRVGGVFT